MAMASSLAEEPLSSLALMLGAAGEAASRSWPKAGLFFSGAMTRNDNCPELSNSLSRGSGGLWTLTLFLLRRS
jgi:hypothetical protein